MPKKPEPSFELKKLVWDIAASSGELNYESIQRQIDSELSKSNDSKSSLFEDTPSIRKLKRIIHDDIDKLTQEVVIAKLPKHVWRLRKDYQEIEDLARGPKKPDEAQPAKTKQTDDERVFGESDAIMSEEQLMSFTRTAEQGFVFYSQVVRAEKWTQFFALESHQFFRVSPKTLCEKAVSSMNELLVFLSYLFCDFDRRLNPDDHDDLTLQMRYSGGVTLPDGCEFEFPKDKEYACKRLGELIDSVVYDYRAYRAQIREQMASAIRVFSPEAVEHDKKIFRQSDKILSERDMVRIGWNMDAGNSIKNDDIPKCDKFIWFFGFETNKYILPELRSKCDCFVECLSELGEFTGPHFFRLDYDRCCGLQAPHELPDGEYNKLRSQLLRLATCALEAYKSYRAAVREILYI